MPLQIKIERKGKGEFVIVPQGQIDSMTYQDFDAKIDSVLGACNRALIINMGGVDYITSNGLGIIFKVKDLMEKKGGKFIMTGLQPQVQEVFKIIKALPSMSVFASLEEADAYLTEIQRQEIEKHKK